MSYKVGLKVFEVTTEYGDLLVACEEQNEVQPLVKEKYPDLQIYNINEVKQFTVFPLEGFAE